MNTLSTLGKELSQQMNHALMGLQLVEPSFQRTVFKRLKTELTQKIDLLLMSSDRKAYFLHQMSNVHEMEELMALVQEMNHLQLKDSPDDGALEIIYPVISSHHISWASLIYPTQTVQ